MPDSLDYTDLQNSLRHLIEDLEHLHDLVNLIRKSLNATQPLPDIVRVYRQMKGLEQSKVFEESIKNLEGIAGLAKKEIDEGYPFLYVQGAIMLYSYLEGAIKRFVITFLKNNNVSQIKEIGSIKIKFADFVVLEETEKFDQLFTEYEKTVTVGMQYGVDRFERLLSPIGFSGVVNSEITKSILELSQIRNNLLHRGGITDKHLIKACPWLQYKIGELLKVTPDKYEEYFNSICAYTNTIVIRLGVKLGLDVSTF